MRMRKRPHGPEPVWTYVTCSGPLSQSVREHGRKSWKLERAVRTTWKRTLTRSYPTTLTARKGSSERGSPPGQGVQTRAAPKKEWPAKGPLAPRGLSEDTAHTHLTGRGSKATRTTCSQDFKVDPMKVDQKRSIQPKTKGSEPFSGFWQTVNGLGFARGGEAHTPQKCYSP